jgi:hypothetical protein
MPQQFITKLDIQPYIGALPMKFGTHRDMVHRVLGPPESSDPIWDNSGFCEHYDFRKCGYNVGYDNAWLANHMGFGPGPVDLSINGQTIWTPMRQSDPNPIFLTLDPDPLTCVGLLCFLQLGVTTTGFHDDDPNQLAITVFSRDKVAWWKENGEPADTSRYARAARPPQ